MVFYLIKTQWPISSQINLTELKLNKGITFAGIIQFEHVIRAINDHAFDTSKFPVILSIENHTCLNVQKNMAECFKSVFKGCFCFDFIPVDPV